MSRQNQFPKINILGLELDQARLAPVVAAIVNFGQSAKSAGYVVRPHVEFIERAHSHPHILKILNQAQFCLVDGVALQWAAFYLHHPGKTVLHLGHSLAHIPTQTKRLRSIISDRFAGPSFTFEILRQSVKKGASVYLIGSPQKRRIKQTADFLQTKFPKLKMAGSFEVGRQGHKVFLTDTMAKQLLSELRQLRPDVILIGMGFPAQEEVMSKLSRQLDHGIFIGEGGSFDYKEFGGHIRRAPTPVRKAGLEWLWRLGRQPKRLGRQMAIPRFIRNVHKHKRQKS